MPSKAGRIRIGRGSQESPTFWFPRLGVDGPTTTEESPPQSWAASIKEHTNSLVSGQRIAGRRERHRERFTYLLQSGAHTSTAGCYRQDFSGTQTLLRLLNARQIIERARYVCSERAESLNRNENAAISNAAKRYATFLDLPLQLSTLNT